MRGKSQIVLPEGRFRKFYFDKMGKSKDPPPFMMDKPYEQWKTEIKAWMYTADAADKNKAALTVALSLHPGPVVIDF